MFILITMVVPTICYLGATAWLAWKGNYYDAMMFFGYSFANIGVMLRLTT